MAAKKKVTKKRSPTLNAALAKEFVREFKQLGLSLHDSTSIESRVRACVATAQRSASPIVAAHLKKQLKEKTVLAAVKRLMAPQIKKAKAQAKKAKAQEKKLAPRAMHGATISASDAHEAVKKVALDDRRVLIADVRKHLKGSKASQDRALLELQREGKIVLYNNDGPRASISDREWDGGIWLPGLERPRTILLRDIRNGG